MRADYDSEGKTLQIELEQVERLQSSDDSVHPRAIVNLADGRPVLVEILGASAGAEEPLGAIAAAYGLDEEALLAAARSALAAPDRVVEVEVLGPSAG